MPSPSKSPASRVESGQRFVGGLPGRELAKADFDHWSKSAYWTFGEATALSLGIEPLRPQVLDLTGRRRTSRPILPPEYDRRYELLGRAKTAGALLDKLLIPAMAVSPPVYLAWAKHLDLSLPGELEAAVGAYHGRGSSNDNPGEFRDLSDLGVFASSVTFVDGDGAGGTPASRQAAAARERQSMLKMIGGMAVKKYRFDPNAGRSPATKNIADDLREVGVALDEDTVRKYLDEAKGLLRGESE